MCIWCVYRCPNACNEDISDCVSGVFIGVLRLVMRISVTVCVSGVFIGVLMLVMRISLTVYLVCL